MSVFSSSKAVRRFTEGNIDAMVYGVLSNNRFSSVHVVAHFTRLPERDVQQSIDRLTRRGLVVLSVGGMPKRYSVVEFEEEYAETPTTHHKSRRSEIQQPDGVVIH
jgi:hypothetical protein